MASPAPKAVRRDWSRRRAETGSGRGKGTRLRPWAWWELCPGELTMLMLFASSAVARYGYLC